MILVSGSILKASGCQPPPSTDMESSLPVRPNVLPLLYCRLFLKYDLWTIIHLNRFWIINIACFRLFLDCRSWRKPTTLGEHENSTQKKDPVGIWTRNFQQSGDGANHYTNVQSIKYQHLRLFKMLGFPPSLVESHLSCILPSPCSVLLYPGFIMGWFSFWVVSFSCFSCCDALNFWTFVIHLQNRGNEQTGQTVLVSLTWKNRSKTLICNFLDSVWKSSKSPLLKDKDLHQTCRSLAAQSSKTSVSDQRFMSHMNYEQACKAKKRVSCNNTAKPNVGKVKRPLI